MLWALIRNGSCHERNHVGIILHILCYFLDISQIFSVLIVLLFYITELCCHILCSVWIEPRSIVEVALFVISEWFQYFLFLL